MSRVCKKLPRATNGRDCHLCSVSLLGLSHCQAAWNEPESQSKVVELGGVQLLLNAMQQHVSNTQVQTCGCWALLSLVRKGNTYNRNAVLRAGMGVNVSAYWQHMPVSLALCGDLCLALCCVTCCRCSDDDQARHQNARKRKWCFDDVLPRSVGKRVWATPGLFSSQSLTSMRGTVQQMLVLATSKKSDVKSEAAAVSSSLPNSERPEAEPLPADRPRQPSETSSRHADKGHDVVGDKSSRDINVDRGSPATLRAGHAPAGRPELSANLVPFRQAFKVTEEVPCPSYSHRYACLSSCLCALVLTRTARAGRAAIRQRHPQVLHHV